MKTSPISSPISWKFAFILSLLVSNLVMYFFGYIAKDQMLFSQSQTHGKIFGRYELEVEKSGKQFSRQNKEDLDDLSPKILSPNWMALKSIKEIYPALAFEIIPADFDTSEKPVGWNTTFEKDGWIQSYFVLNSKSKSLLKVSTYVKEELSLWHKNSIIMGITTFLLLFSSALYFLYKANSNSKNNPHEVLLRKVHLILVEIEFCIKQLKASIASIEKNSPQNAKVLKDELINITNQMKVLSVNGSIETFKKSVDVQFVENLFIELNNLSCKVQDKVTGDLTHSPVLDLQPLAEKFEDLHQIVEKTLDQSLKFDPTYRQEAV